MSYKDWKTYKLGEFVDVQNGFAFKTTDFAEKGIPIIKIKNIISPKIDFDYVQYFNGNVNERLKQFLISKKDILISMTGSHINQIASAVGKVGRYQFDFPALLNQRVGKVYIKDSKIGNEDYLFYFLNRFETQLELASSAGGSANQANISPSQIKNLEITLPDIKTQERIASILSSLDEKIELNQATNQTLKSIAENLFIEWFVNFNFPNSTGEFQSSELGKIPLGWRIAQLGDVSDLTWGDTNTTKQSYTSDGYLAFSASGPDGLLSYFDFDRKGIVVSAIGAYAGRTWFAMSKWSCIKNTIKFWSNNEEISNEYLFLATKGINKWPLRGSAQPFISQADARAMKIIYPNNGLSQKFGGIISPLYECIDLNEIENKSLLSFRDSLIPKLMKGEIEV